MKVLGLVLLGLVLIASSFVLKAWNGEHVSIPGVNRIVDAIKKVEVEEDSDEGLDENLEPSESEIEEVKPDLSISRLMVERNMKQIMTFEDAKGFLRVGDDEEYKHLVSALSRFSVEGGAQATLDAARGSRNFPLFFSVDLDEKVEEEPIHRVVGIATVEGCKDREEAYPIKRGMKWFTIGNNPLVTPGELQTPSFKTMREFVEVEIASIVGSADKEAILEAAQKGFESDLKFFEIQATPGIMSAKVWWAYKKGSEQSMPSVRFLPYMERRAVSTHPVHQERRNKFAEALDLDPDRLQEAIEEIVKETNTRRALVSYWPHRSKLTVEVPSVKTDVDIRVLSPEDLWRESYRVGSALLGTQVSIDDLETHILDQLGLYEDVKGQRIYQHSEFPNKFVRLTRESKSGTEPKVLSYRNVRELIPMEIKNRAQLQAVIQRVLDQDPKETHFGYGCLQGRKEIMEVFSQYQNGFENPSNAFPCYMGYDYAVRQVVMFQKVEEEDGKTATAKETASADPGILGSYGLREISDKSVKKVKDLIYKDHEVSIPLNTAAYKQAATDFIKREGIPVKLDGKKIVGGYVQLDVSRDGLALSVVPE